jgi:dipeptidyl aminopeptidase/acylaminoacyl peptidase
MIRRMLAALAALVLMPATVHAAPADPAVAFGAREAIEDIHLSPSGSKIAFIAPGKGQATILFTVDATGGSQPRQALVADGKPERLDYCFWVSEERLVCRIYMIVDQAGFKLPFSRYMAVDADGGKARILSRPIRAYDAYVSQSGGAVIDALPGEDGAVLMGQHYVPEQRQGTHLNDDRQGFGVERLDTRNGSTRVIEQPKRDAVEYISDGRGLVRIMGTRGQAGATGYDSSVVSYYYRTKGSRDWKPLNDYDLSTQQGFNPYAVDPDLDVAYGFKRANGRLALYSVSLDGAKRETLIYSHPQVDVDGLVRIGRNGRVVGTTFATEKRQAVYFDAELQALGRSLSKALPGLPLIRFIDSSVDESKLLILAMSDTDPGRYYIFDKTAKRLNEIMVARPDLEGATLAQVKPVTYKAADGTEVPAYLTLPAGSDGRNLPAIVMPHGGPESRDEWGFDWLVQYFASRGYAVLQPNYRGSSGYGDAWFQLNGYQSWRTALGDVNDGGRWLVSQGIADPKKLVIFGWSYGGYAALQSNVLDPGLYRAIAAVAPVTDFAQMKQEALNWSSYRLMRDRFGSGPHITEGSPAQNAARIRAPVLLFHGDRDLNVPILQSRMMADRLKDAGKKVELIVYPDLDHSLVDGEVRADMLRRVDAFFRANFES